MHGKGEIMGRLMKKLKNKQYGQAMAEFALTIPVFLLLVFGIIELSRFFLIYSSVFTASREATRFASSVGEINNENYLDCGAIAQRAVFSGQFGGVQENDVTIFYESSPGTIVASCPNVNPGSVPLEGNCHNNSVDCINNPPDPFIPELGDRVWIEIETDFDSLLGIVPDLPVRANNGRTIMMEIGKRATANPGAICSVDVNLVGNLQQRVNKAIVYVEIENISEITNYQLVAINQVDWKVSGGKPLLNEITWNGNTIWSEVDSIPILNINTWTEEHNRNLVAQTIVPIEFIFNQDVNQNNLDLSFILGFQNANDPSRTCTIAVSD